MFEQQTIQDFNRGTTSALEVISEDDLNKINEAVSARNSNEINTIFKRNKDTAQKLLDENVFPSIADGLMKFHLEDCRIKCSLV